MTLRTLLCLASVAVLFLLTVPVLGASDPQTISYVQIVAKENVTLLNSGKWMVEFYAPWCGHCKRLIPIYEQLAKAAASEEHKDKNVNVAKFDCVANNEACRMYSVHSYPSLYFFNEGAMHEFVDERNLAGLTKFALHDGWRVSPGFGLPKGTDYAFVRFFQKMDRDFYKIAHFSLWYVVCAFVGIMMLIIGAVSTFLYLLVKSGNNTLYADDEKEEEKKKKKVQVKKKVRKQD